MTSVASCQYHHVRFLLSLASVASCQYHLPNSQGLAHQPKARTTRTTPSRRKRHQWCRRSLISAPSRIWVFTRRIRPQGRRTAGAPQWCHQGGNDMQLSSSPAPTRLGWDFTRSTATTTRAAVATPPGHIVKTLHCHQSWQVEKPQWPTIRATEATTRRSSKPTWDDREDDSTTQGIVRRLKAYGQTTQTNGEDAKICDTAVHTATTLCRAQQDASYIHRVPLDMS
jgi:hypothetical protein